MLPGESMGACILNIPQPPFNIRTRRAVIMFKVPNEVILSDLQLGNYVLLPEFAAKITHTDNVMFVAMLTDGHTALNR
jgi:hypothetical protein